MKRVRLIFKCSTCNGIFFTPLTGWKNAYECCGCGRIFEGIPYEEQLIMEGSQ